MIKIIIKILIMKQLDIREQRKKLGITQEVLAKTIGVSRKTIINYEKGEVIPETKRELLLKILHNEQVNVINEPGEFYGEKTGFDEKIQEYTEKINTILDILKFMDKNNEEFIHYKNMLKLYQKTVLTIQVAKINMKNDL